MRGLESRGWSTKDGGRGGEEEEEDEAELDEVQIMELHSANPVISYRGRVYAAQWHQNIGTEFLLTRHDDDSHLPVLRHLDDGVDLLAASSARISVAQKELKRKDNPDNDNINNHSTRLHQPRRRRGKRQARSSRSLGFIARGQDGEEVEDENDDEIDALVPPPDSGASQARVDQGNFLRNFIALKRSRGETDEVPVLTSADHLPKRAASKKKTTTTTITTLGRGRGQGAGGGRPRGSRGTRRGRGGRGGGAAGLSARSLLHIAAQLDSGSAAPDGGGGGGGGDDDGFEMANLDPALSAVTPARFADAAAAQPSSTNAAGGSMDADTGAGR
ncbi:TFIIIC subunit triple barrel domain-containing protein [Microdochium nivale]|nr:TFIIIC subunit triple barrel domain-containing protein [Microdochium nivale]